jgi:hypothetical protein
MMRLGLLLLLSGCLLNRWNDVHPQRQVSYGTVTKIHREWKYEAPCGVLASIKHQCNDYPSCCAYTVTLTDSTGHKTYFVAWWPSYAEGLHPGETSLFVLHWLPMPHLLDCAGTQAMSSAFCGYEMGWAVTGDSDVVRR